MNIIAINGKCSFPSTSLHTDLSFADDYVLFHAIAVKLLCFKCELIMTAHVYTFHCRSNATSLFWHTGKYNIVAVKGKSGTEIIILVPDDYVEAPLEEHQVLKHNKMKVLTVLLYHSKY